MSAPIIQASRSLEGKVAIVTGASRGIGHGIALALAGRGAKVVITYSSDRSRSSAGDLVTTIKTEFGSEAIEVQCDLADVGAPKHILEAAIDAFGHVDILVNNAAAISDRSLTDVTPEHFADIFNLNVRAPLLMVQAALPHMRQPGRIINISSVGSRGGYPGTGTYAASKAALEGYSRVWAHELGATGTTVNCVNPGPVESEMLAQVDPKIIAPQKAATAIENRLGTVEEIANIVAFLAGPDASWISGQCLSASGGYQMY